MVVPRVCLVLVARVRVEAVVALSLPLSWPVATRVGFCCAAAVVILVLVDFDFVVAVAAVAAAVDTAAVNCFSGDPGRDVGRCGKGLEGERGKARELWERGESTFEVTFREAVRVARVLAAFAVFDEGGGGGNAFDVIRGPTAPLARFFGSERSVYAFSLSETDISALKKHKVRD